MAKLGPYFGTHTGTQDIYVGFFDVGSGTFTIFTDTEVDFSGSYNAFGQAGNFAIRIILTDGKPTATSGPCTVILNNDTDDQAKYEIHGAQLTISTTLNPAPVIIYRNKGGTQINGISGHNLWIGQSTTA